MTEFERDVSDERSPEQIEIEIQRTRNRMSSNVDELGDRLSPDNLKQQAKEAISEKAQDVVTAVGDQARETSTRMVDFITRNPLPVAAVGLGAIWLFTLRQGNRSAVSGDRMARFAYTGPERREPKSRPGVGRRFRDRAASVRQGLSDTASDMGERAGELKERARDARGGLERMMNDNPLAVAGGAAIIGLALGLLLPETEPERRVMGETRDEVVDRVQQAAGRVREVAVEAGRDLQETVREEASQRVPEVKGALREAVTTVKDRVKDSAARGAKEAKREISGPQPDGGEVEPS